MSRTTITALLLAAAAALPLTPATAGAQTPPAAAPDRPAATGQQGMGPPGMMGGPGMTGQRGMMGPPGTMGQPGTMGPPGTMGQRGMMGGQGMTGQPGMMGQPGVMGGPGMMGGQGMMGGPGMMGGQGMMGAPCMMDQAGMPGGGGPGMRGMMFEHVEGRLAFLRTELKITEAQTPQWNAFAEAVREVAAAMREMHQAMWQAGMPATLPERLDRHEAMLTMRLEALRRVEPPLAELYGQLSDEQKQTADRMMMGPM